MRDTRDQGGAGRGRRMLPGPGLLLLLLACVSASAQVYKWTDAQGTVHYGDAPPPQRPSSQLKTPSQDGAGQATLPYELARAVKTSPVTLYTTTQSACAGCDQGRALLRARGVPFTEKTVNTDEDKEGLRRLGGKLELPLLVVGAHKIAGFQEAAWQDALTAAAYPRSAQLPPGYQNAAPEPAAPVAAPGKPYGVRNPAPPDEAAAQAAEQLPRRPAAREATQPATPPAKPPTKPPTGNAPPGFQF